MPFYFRLSHLSSTFFRIDLDTLANSLQHHLREIEVASKYDYDKNCELCLLLKLIDFEQKQHADKMETQGPVSVQSVGNHNDAPQ